MSLVKRLAELQVSGGDQVAAWRTWVESAAY